MIENFERRRQFAHDYVVNGGNATAAAVSSGFSQRSARQIAHRLLARADVQRFVRDEKGRWFGRLGVKSLAVVEGLLEDPETPAGVRLDAAKAIWDRCGWPVVPANMIARTMEPTDPSDMSADELKAFIRKGMEQLRQIELEAAEGAGEQLRALEHSED